MRDWPEVGKIRDQHERFDFFTRNSVDSFTIGLKRK